LIHYPHAKEQSMVKQVFTTGAVAKIARVAPRTVSKWFDSGKLKGYRIPGSQDRRIPRENLIRFLRENDMPQADDLAAEEGLRVLLVGVSGEPSDRLEAALVGAKGLRLERTDHAFDAGLLVYEFRPTAVVVDLSVGRGEAARIASAVRRVESSEPRPGPLTIHPFAPALLVALAGEDGLGEEDCKALADAGFDHCLTAPVDPAALAGVILAGRGE
jgi:two-component system response regulator RpaA